MKPLRGTRLFGDMVRPAGGGRRRRCLRAGICGWSVSVLLCGPALPVQAEEAGRCGVSSTITVCIQAGRVAGEQVLALLGGGSGGAACGPSTRSEESGGLSRTFSDAVALHQALGRLHRHRISYAMAGAGPGGACLRHLSILSVADGGFRAMWQPGAADAPVVPGGTPFPEVSGDPARVGDVAADFERLRARFTRLDPKGKEQALDLMHDFVADWEHEPSWRFIEGVARGAMQYQVPDSVRAHARRLLAMFDTGG